MRDAVTVHMRANVEQVWDLVSDVTRIGEFSPETFEAEWLGGATGPAPGAHFRGHVRRNGIGPVYWTHCKVTDCEPGRVFGFSVYAGRSVVNTWRYDLAAAGDGVDVTESFRLATNPATRVYWTMFGRWRRRTNLNGMRQTLERIRAVVESA